MGVWVFGCICIYVSELNSVLRDALQFYKSWRFSVRVRVRVRVRDYWIGLVWRVYVRVL